MKGILGEWESGRLGDEETKRRRDKETKRQRKQHPATSTNVNKITTIIFIILTV
jgi:hypothetical protein